MFRNESPVSGQAPTQDLSDPREQLLHAAMSPFQIAAVAITLLLCMLDGFDVLTISFAAPAILREWGIDKAQLGFALSAGLLGMAMGALTIAPLGDMTGRRKVLFLSLAMMISGTLWTATTFGLTGLVASRVITGLGIGAMIGVIYPLAAEYSNARRRDLAISVLSLGYPIGGILGGLLSSYLLATHGWRAIFLFAAGMGVVLAVLVWLVLIEPLALVVARPGKDGLHRANTYLARCGHGPVTVLPPPPASVRMPIASLFAPDMARATLTITAIYFLYMIPQFFMQAWLPTLVADLGLPPAKGALVAAFFSMGGVAAALFIGTMSLRIGIKRLEIGLLIGAAVAISGFAALPGILGALIGGAVISGFFVMGGMIGLYAIIARTFPAHLRASGTGFVVGLGRLGSILPPMIAGTLSKGGMGREELAMLMAAPAIIAMIALLTFKVRAPTTA
jgi:MFS family permease